MLSRGRKSQDRLPQNACLTEGVDMAKEGSVRGLFPVDILTSSTIPEKGEAADFISTLSYNGKEAEVLQCSKCSGQVAATRATVSVQAIFSSFSDYSVPSLYCGKCHFPWLSGERTCPMIVGLHVADEWWTVEELLTSRDSSRQGFHKVETLGERLVLFVLNRIVYRCCDMDSNTDSPFLTHSAKETAKLLWVDGKAVGFYTVKLKGTLCHAFLNKVYGLNLIDTIFIRKSYRNHGYGLQLLEDILESHSEGNVGFSYPMSDSMYAVCYKYLQGHVEDRDYLWECLAPGDEMQRANIWLQLHGERKAIAQAVEAKISLTTPVNGDMGSSEENSMEVEESADDSVCTPSEEEVTEPKQPEGSQENDIMMQEEVEDQEEEDKVEKEKEEEVPEATEDEMEEEEMESQVEEEEVQVVDVEEEGKDEEHSDKVQVEETADEEVEETNEEEEQIPEEAEVEEEKVEEEKVEEAVTEEEEEEEKKQEDAPEALDGNVGVIDTPGAEDAAAVVESIDHADAAEITENGDEEKQEDAEAEPLQKDEEELHDNELETEATLKDKDTADKADEDPDSGSPAEEAEPENVVVEEGCETTGSQVEDASTAAVTTQQDNAGQETEATEESTTAEDAVPHGEPDAPPAEVEEEPVQYNDTAVEAEEMEEEKAEEKLSHKPETAAVEGTEKIDMSGEASTSQEGTQVQELPTEPLACKENEASGSKDQDSADSSQEDVEEVKQKRGRGRPRKNAREAKAPQETEENEMFDKENTTDEELSTGKDQDTGESSQDEETEELKKPQRRTPRGKGRKRRSKMTEDEENVPSPRVSKRRKV
ncbi:uncharacterized protein LOC144876512 isoform X1 [Branchiostoma floridae x Branchiostoma japonicum]